MLLKEAREVSLLEVREVSCIDIRQLLFQESDEVPLIKHRGGMEAGPPEGPGGGIKLDAKMD